MQELSENLRSVDFASHSPFAGPFWFKSGLADRDSS